MDAEERPAAGTDARSVALAVAVAVVIGWLAAVTLGSGGGGSLRVSVEADDTQLGIERNTDVDAGLAELPAVARPPWTPPTDESWAVLPEAPIGPRIGHTVAAVDGDVIVWGGYQRGRPLSNGARFSVDTGTWNRMQDAPWPEAGHAAVAAGRTLLLLDERHPMAYDIDAERWRELPPPRMPDGALMSHVTAWTGRVAVVLTATFDGRPTEPLAYDIVENSWRQLLPVPPVPLSNDHALVWNGRELLLFGPNPAGAEAFGHRLVFGSSTLRPLPGAGWEPVSPPPLDPRATLNGGVRAVSSSSVRAGDPVYVWVGPRFGGPPAPLLLSYEAAGTAATPGNKDRWSLLAPPPLHEAVPELAMTGEELLVMGRTGAAAYDPRTDVFRRLPVPDIPPGQQREAAWTGTHVITWGGATGDGAVWRPGRVSDVLDVAGVPDRLPRGCRAAPDRCAEVPSAR